MRCIPVRSKVSPLHRRSPPKTNMGSTQVAAQNSVAFSVAGPPGPEAAVTLSSACFALRGERVGVDDLDEREVRPGIHVMPFGLGNGGEPFLRSTRAQAVLA